MPPWYDIALVIAVPIVSFVVLTVLGTVISTTDYHGEDGRVDANVLHRIRKDDAR